MHYPCSENKGADQLCGYREADLRLCFRICKKPVFSRRSSNMMHANDVYPMKKLHSIKPKAHMYKIFHGTTLQRHILQIMHRSLYKTIVPLNKIFNIYRKSERHVQNE